MTRDPVTSAHTLPTIAETDSLLRAAFSAQPAANPDFQASLRQRLLAELPSAAPSWKRPLWRLQDGVAGPRSRTARLTSLVAAAACLAALALPTAAGLAGGLPPVLRLGGREAMDRDYLTASGALVGIDGWFFPVPGGGGTSFISTPFRASTPFGTDHPGLDIAARLGTPVVATAGGTVEYAAFGDNVSWSADYGVVVAIRHSLRVLSVYAQLEDSLNPRDIRPGQPIKAGSPIGRIGRTGRSTGPHLHFEVRVDGRPIDPTWLNLRTP